MYGSIFGNAPNACQVPDRSVPLLPLYGVWVWN